MVILSYIKNNVEKTYEIPFKHNNINYDNIISILSDFDLECVRFSNRYCRVYSKYNIHDQLKSFNKKINIIDNGDDLFSYEIELLTNDEFNSFIKEN